MTRTLVILLALASVPAHLLASTTFNDVTAEVGVEVLASSMWGAGVGFIDHNMDGNLDLYVVDGFGDPNVFFENDGSRNFTEIAGTLGLDDTGWGKSVSVADIDNDGDPDILLTNYDPAQTNRLFRNDGNVFTDITSGSGMDFADKCTGAAWTDYDGDGLLDAYITVYDGSHSNRLMHNLGGGIFSNEAEVLGVSDDTGWGYQPGWLDYDNDGDMDLYIANDDFFGGTQNVLFRNDGDGTFTDVSVESGANPSIASMGLAIGDYDNDSFMDIYITNIEQGNVLLHNNGDGTFTDVAEELGVKAFRLSWGSNFFDCDNDGWLDLYVAVSSGGIHGGDPPSPDGDTYPNLLYLNNGTTFDDISATSGSDNEGKSFCSAVGDYDDDGDLDIYLTNEYDLLGDSASVLYENTQVPRGGAIDNWLRVKLLGTTSNRDAVGARVWIKTDAGWQYRERTSGTSYLSCDEPILHFGLGASNSISQLYVRWPSGLAEGYFAIPGGQTISLVEGDGVPTSVEEPMTESPVRLRVGPNPFRRGTDIFLESPLLARGRLTIHDAAGRRVRTLATQPSADGIARWDGRNDAGAPVPAGIYLLRVVTGGGKATGAKIIRVR